MRCFLVLALNAILLATWTTAAVRAAENSAPLREIFAHPPRDYSTGPLWTWNDLLTEQQVLLTLRDLAAQHVRQVWVHPQPGLMTPYLSDDWFRLWRIALDEAKKLDMNIWIYDENSYPSGFAGGYVPDSMPESRGRGLHFREVKTAGPLTSDVLAVFRPSDNAFTDVTPELRAGQLLPEATYLKAVVVRAPNTPWNAGRSYVNLLYPGVTQRFLDITLEPYRKRFAEEFGKQIPGVFTDEPSILPAGGLPWTDDLPQQFRQRWGYELMKCLPSLVRPTGDWRRVRHNYFHVLLDLYIQRWAIPYYEYCDRNGLELTGHYLEHEWPRLIHTPDFMALQAWEHRPGIDILMNQFQEQPHAQLGNVRIVKEIGSVANQLGRRRTLSETYAGSGHEIRFEEMKRQGDWQFVLGLNTLNECLSHITIRGVRKGNWPRTLSYHNPWWDAYHVLEDYFTRMAAAMSFGQQMNRVLVLEPTTTAWMYQNDPGLEALGVQFQSLLHRLEQEQIEYDLGSEDILARHASVRDAQLVVGQASYATIVLPQLTENLDGQTVKLLTTFLGAGATVYCCGPPPERVDGKMSSEVQALAASAAWKQVDVSALPSKLGTESTDGFAIQRQPDSRGRLYHQRRQFSDGQLLLLVNSSTEQPSRGMIRSPARGVEQWYLETGTIAPRVFTSRVEGIEVPFVLPPCGSLLLFLSETAIEPAPATLERMVRLDPVAVPQVHRQSDNVLVLDYLEWKTAGQSSGAMHCREATPLLFKQNGFPGNPWFEAVQFADEHVSRPFGPETAFEVTYRFTIQAAAPKNLRFVVERPDLYSSITCNGATVNPTAQEWWLDRSFGCIDIHQVARTGENVVTLKASQFTVFHELEPAYVLGDFTLHNADHGFTIVPEVPLELSSQLGWNAQGNPFYGAGVAYVEEFDITESRGQCFVELPDWNGSVAKVVVNGQKAGYIGWRPWECDVTELIRPGRNRIEVTVIGTLRNTLGPFHSGPPQGIVTPHMFNQVPPGGQPAGEHYTSIRYGLFQPFVLKLVQPESE